MKRLVCITAIAFLMISGCATPGWRSFRAPLPEETRRQVRSVAVVPGQFVPESNFRTFAKSVEEGSAKGVESGAARGALQGAGTALKAGPFGILLLPFMTVLGATVGGVAGGIEGASKSVPAEETQKIEAMIAAAVADLKVQETLAERVAVSGPALTGKQMTLLKGLGPTAQERQPAEYNFELMPEEQKPSTEREEPASKEPRPDYRSLSAQGFDMVIETSVRELGFVGGRGDDPSIAFFMTMQVRAVSPRDGLELYQGTLSHISRPRTTKNWGLNNAALVQREFENAYAGLAERIVEHLFLTHDFNLKSMLVPDVFCMMNPLYPRQPNVPGMRRELRFGMTDSLTPTFAWEAFPRVEDQEADSSGILKRITDITYDLRVWKGHAGFPDEMVYEQRRLNAVVRTGEVTKQANETNEGQPESANTKPVVLIERIAEHTIEAPLDLASEYYWSVRARFKLDGQTRLTKWSHYRVPNFLPMQRGYRDPCLADYIPVTHYFRFKTPEFAVQELTGEKDLKCSAGPVPPFPATRAAATAEDKSGAPVIGKAFYITANIWYRKPDKIYSTNYHEGTILPIGTKVRIEQIVERAQGDDPFSGAGEHSIRFVDDNGRSYTMIFKGRHAADDMTIRDLFSQYFSEANPLAEGGAFHSLPPNEQDNVRIGKISPCMSKAAVLMAFGYPPSHRTPTLQDNTWTYWESGKITTTIHFRDERVIRISR